MESELHPIFKAYREYVGLCIENGTEPSTVAEFSGKPEPFKVAEEVEPNE